MSDDITKFEAELEALSEKFHANQAKRKALVIDDPVELFQALSPVGMSVTGDEKKLYYLLGLLTKQGFEIDPKVLGIEFEPIDLMVAPEILDTVKELAEYIETAVENYLEENSDG